MASGAACAVPRVAVKSPGELFHARRRPPTLLTITSHEPEPALRVIRYSGDQRPQRVADCGSHATLPKRASLDSLSA